MSRYLDAQETVPTLWEKGNANTEWGGEECSTVRLEQVVPVLSYKIQHLFMIKPLRKTEIEGTVLNLKNCF